MNEALKKYYEYLKGAKADVPNTYESFESTLSDEVAASKYYEYLKANNFDAPDTFESFSNTLGLKKKVETILDGSEVPTTDSGVSGEAQPPLQPEPPKERQPLKDLIRTLTASGLKSAGAIANTPKHINRTLLELTAKPIMKLMGASEEETHQSVENMLSVLAAKHPIIAAGEVQKPLVKKATEIEEKMYQLEGDIWSNLIKGKDGEQDLGVALEQFGRGVVASIPMLLQVAATAPAGPLAVYATIAATSASLHYAETEGMSSTKRNLNSWGYGGFEALGELASAYIFGLIGKSFRQGLIKQISPKNVSHIAKGIAESVGLEGSSEAMTQIGQNFTAIVTGEDPERNLFAGARDATIIGGLGFGLGGGVARGGASMLGRAMAADKEVSQVQENFKQQEVLIDQIEQTDSDPVKEALKRSIKDLRVQSDEIMDENYELATKLTPEQQNQVAELYSVWNELQDKVDSGKLTPAEVPAMEKTIQGIKDQIQTIKDDLVTRLEEGAKAEKETKVEAVKEEQKTELDKLKEEETKKLDKAKDVPEGEKVDKGKLDAIKEKYDTKIEEIKEKTEEELEKIEDEYAEKPAEEIVPKEKEAKVEEPAPKEEYKISGRTFATKEELFKYLDEIGLTEEGLLNKDWFDGALEVLPELPTLKAIDEWKDIKDKEIAERFKEVTPKLETKEEIEDAERRTQESSTISEESRAETGIGEVQGVPIRDNEPYQETETGEAREIVPQPPTPPITETGVGETKFRLTQVNSLIQDKTRQQQEVAKIIDTNREKYSVLHQANAVIQAKDFIDNSGVREATAQLKESTKKMDDFPMRQVARQVLLDFYSRAIIDPNASKTDKNEAFRAIDDLSLITAREATKAGQGNAMLQIWKSMQPAGLLEYVARKIATSNQKTLDKKIGDTTLGGQLDALYETLNEESKKIINDILEGKPVSMPKDTERPAKEIPPKKTVSKEKIKKEQDYRKNLLEQYRKSGKPLSAAVTGLTSEQIELGGNLVASYIREGYYRLEEIVNKLIKDLKSVGVDVDDKQANEILGQTKSPKETYAEYIDRIESKARVRAGEKLISKRINDVLIEHWTVKDDLRRTLAQKLVDEAGLTEAEAQRLEKEILEKFDREILKRAQKHLTKILGITKLPQEKTKKGLVGKMIDLINLGALDEDIYRNLFAEKFKLIELTDQHKEEILRLANNVQMASGRGWLERDATIRLTKYIYELYPEAQAGEMFDTWISMAYANMLFGPSTSLLNLWSAGWNMTTKPIRDIANLSKWAKLIKETKRGEGDIYNPFGEMFYVPMLRGSEAGTTEAREVYINGDLNNKYIEDVAKKNQFKVTPLERQKYGKGKRFKPVNVKIGNKSYDLNIFNAYKYSGRNLAAQDKFMLSTSYEVEIAHILRDKFKNRELKGRELTREVMSALRGERIDMDKINESLRSDIKLYKEMTGEDMTDIQQKIRKRELMLDELPITKEEKAEAEQLARSNIFTDERGGLVATMAYAIGRIASRGHAPAFVIKAFVPFTHVVGNVAEYMLDHVPFYGFIRANGMSLSNMKKLNDPEAMSAQMGEVGSRLYYEQMGRAWLGTMSFILMGMIALGNDEDDFVEVSGGYSQEGFKKRGRENVLPPYTLRIGKVKIPYKNIPGLAIPLALIGNVNDGLKMKQDEGDLMNRMTLALLWSASLNTVFMFKDMSFLDGTQRLTQIVSDMASADEAKMEAVAEGLIKSYLGLATRPLPQNNNAIQQIWKIFDPQSYPQNDITSILMYTGGIQHFSKYPAVDQMGDAVKTYPGETLLPYTHWLNIKGKDERWKFLAKHNAIPNKIYNRTIQIEESTGIEKRKLEENELYDYSTRAGKLFSDALTNYMSDTEKISKRASEIGEREKANGDIEKISGIREDVEKLWAKSKSDAEIELFRWGSVKEDMPQTWALIKKHQAYHPYQTSKETEGYSWNDSELYEFNNRVALHYAKITENYLKSSGAEDDKKKDSNNNGINNFQENIDRMWDKARTSITAQMKGEIKNKKRATKK